MGNQFRIFCSGILSLAINIWLSKSKFHDELNNLLFGGIFLRFRIYVLNHRRLKTIEAVVGFEVINEPHPGYIGLESLHSWDELKELRLGESPTALQSFLLGEGIPQVYYFLI